MILTFKFFSPRLLSWISQEIVVLAIFLQWGWCTFLFFPHVVLRDLCDVSFPHSASLQILPTSRLDFISFSVHLSVVRPSNGTLQLVNGFWDLILCA